MVCKASEKKISYGEFRTAVPSDGILQSEHSSTVLAGPAALPSLLSEIILAGLVMRVCEYV